MFPILQAPIEVKLSQIFAHLLKHEQANAQLYTLVREVQGQIPALSSRLEDQARLTPLQEVPFRL